MMANYIDLVRAYMHPSKEICFQSKFAFNCFTLTKTEISNIPLTIDILKV